MTPKQSKVQCCEVVWDRDMRRHFPCPQTSKVERNGKPYCGRHDPEAIAARRKKQDAKWDAQQKARRSVEDAKDRIAAARDAVVAAAEAYQARSCAETFRKLMEAVRALRAAREHPL